MATQHIIIQSSGSYEVRSMLGLAARRDLRVTRSTASVLHRHEEALETGALPIGSVEFVRAALDIVGVKPPAPLSYPASLTAYLHRDVECIALYDLDRRKGECFLKPAGSVKLFDGFILSDTPAEDSAEEGFRQEQREKLTRIPATSGIYVAELVTFQSEWRVYVHKNKIIGNARYDDGADNAKAPSERAIKEMIREFKKSGQAPVAYALDVGVLANGKTALVEVNDAWALGLYKDMEDHDAYLAMLVDRWHDITGFSSAKKAKRSRAR